MSNEMIVHQLSMQEVHRLAQSMVKSGMFSVKDVDQAMMLMSIAIAEGRHPATVARDMDIIQGRAAKKAEAMYRDALAAGTKVEWHENTDTACEATFSHPRGGTARIRWDIERATRAGLAGKDNWKKYPRSMLRSRVVSEGSRTVCPMATSGLYTPQEVDDFDIPEARPVSITAAVEQAAQIQTPADVTDHETAIRSQTNHDALKKAFAVAWGSTHDKDARARYKAAYDATLALIDEAARSGQEEATE